MKGIAASPGIAIGKAFLLKVQKATVTKKNVNDTDSEVVRLNKAVELAKSQLDSIYKNACITLGIEEAKIFEAHLALVEDPMMINETTEIIRTQFNNAEWALKETSDKYSAIFEAMENEYMAQRAADIKDVTSRVIDILMDVTRIDISHFAEKVVIVAEDLLPSDTARMDKKNVAAIVTELGSRQSHTAIIARNLGIPAVVGLKGALSLIGCDETIIVDGSTGEIIVNPTESETERFLNVLNEQNLVRANLLELKQKPSITKDGFKVHIMANIGTPDEAIAAFDNGAEGIGLFRTEFLYMDRSSLPSEEEQFEAYKKVALIMQGKPVVVRTLDIGGDKELPYLGLEKEENPFLGYRAIRYCLDRQDVFRKQLRAILRASAFGQIKIMFPMIAVINELREAKKILNEEKEKLLNESIDVDNNIEVGIMVEIPSCAIAADVFAKEADFFSIGTNDLTQYTLAVDRGNLKVSDLYSHYNPSLLRLIKYVIDSAAAQGIWCGMCGEAAADKLLIPLLLGMGLNEFSMSPPSVLEARKIVNNTEKSKFSNRVGDVISLATADEIGKYLEGLAPEVNL